MFIELEKMNSKDLDIYRENVLKYFHYRRTMINKIINMNERRFYFSFFQDEKKMFIREFVKYLNFRRRKIKRRNSV